ncbi:hypothetical protein Mapa_011008 [Marchantia paleacea]|nr:hypothetical protein Mapa_011008 [Marchantia paleacea]
MKSQRLPLLSLQWGVPRLAQPSTSSSPCRTSNSTSAFAHNPHPSSSQSSIKFSRSRTIRRTRPIHPFLVHFFLSFFLSFFPSFLPSFLLLFFTSPHSSRTGPCHHLPCLHSFRGHRSEDQSRDKRWTMNVVSGFYCAEAL